MAIFNSYICYSTRVYPFIGVSTGVGSPYFFLVWHSLLVGEMTVLMAANISQEAAGADASPSIPYGNLLTLTILAHAEQTPCKDL